MHECRASPKDLGAAAKPMATTSGEMRDDVPPVVVAVPRGRFIAGYTTHRNSWQESATLAEIYARQILAAMEPE
jgi:hypothetical protein